MYNHEGHARIEEGPKRVIDLFVICFFKLNNIYTFFPDQSCGLGCQIYIFYFLFFLNIYYYIIYMNTSAHPEQ